MRCPSRTPAGMRALTSRRRRSTPRPAHCGHGSVTIVPRPAHWGHTCENENGPWSTRISPLPPHCGQTSGGVPGSAPDPWHTEHTASAVKLTLVVTPRTASRKSRCNSVSRSAPRCGPAFPAPAPPRPPTPPAPAPAAAAAEQAAEQVTEGGALVELERPNPLGAAGPEPTG